MNLDRLKEHRAVVKQAGWNGAADAMADAGAELAAIVAAVRDYHLALDLRQHGGVAAGKAIAEIERALAMPWVQGAEQARRGWRPMSEAPKGRPTESAGCRGPSEWFVGRKAPKYDCTFPSDVIRRRAWPQDDGWEDCDGSTFVPDYFDAWKPCAAVQEPSST